MGAAIHDEYLSMILMSLPDTYTTQTLADVAISSGCTFTAHDFISKATELTDKQQLWATHDPKLNQKDSTLHVTDGLKKGKKNNSSNRDIECFNCHKKGHFACDCCGPGGAKEGQHPSKGRSSKGADSTANSATPVQGGTWSAIAFGSPAEDESTYLD